MEHPGIRDATIDDAERVSQLMTELGYPTTAEARRDRLGAICTHPNYATFVADRFVKQLNDAGRAHGRPE